MKRDLMDIVCCPVCKADLELEVDEEDDETGEVETGTLTCTECGEVYDIEDGIPDLLPPEMQDEDPAEA